MITSETTGVREGGGNILDAEMARMEIIAPAFVREAISRLGRTEDLRFSPDNRKLAVAGFVANTCMIFDIEVDRSAARPVVRLNDFIEIRSDSFKGPHGLDFIGGNLLLVANRCGGISLFAMPERPAESRVVHVRPIREVRRISLLRRLNSPGSLCVLSASDDQVEILVCNNYSHRITRHVIPIHAGLCRPQNDIFLNQGFQIPDGIAINPDKSWLAISNHSTHSVLMFDLKAGLEPSSVAVGHLTGMAYPHGIRFSEDGRRFFVADAGAPSVHVYEADGAGWRGERGTIRSLAVLSEETYLKGRVSPQEGGPKGIDLNAAGDVLAVTCHEQPLAFFHLPELVG
ncbi:hypothetical protein [Prosthecobacter sp.]|uniref:YncE family protein n=1 Tax=Prosthecobacter sp. TaxID=1965333 RepID=UPI002ABA8BF8|nr:hypothetical protein [Prosthecobacter sp.]MDZ4401212.1 hypothetical protein [Prosthecobacter sp.]